MAITEAPPGAISYRAEHGVLSCNAAKVGDLWAALARQEAARAGVGLSYWFGWYAGGTAPGSYSVLTPLLSAAVGAYLLAGASTIAVVGLTYRVVRGTRHPQAALWVVTVAAGANLWSGRVAFVVGCALGLAALLAMQSGRRVQGALAGIATVLMSPLAGAFLLLTAVSVAITNPGRRVAGLTCSVTTVVTLVGVAFWYGAPGPEGFTIAAAVASATLLGLMLLARPSRPVALAIGLSLTLIPLLVLVPNGMGSNVLRWIYAVLPVAVAATARSRRWLTAVAVVPALAYCVSATVLDLSIAAAPNSQPSYYTGLKQELSGLSAPLMNHRLEVVSDGTHAAAYALLDQAALARGYETQADNALDPIFTDPQALTASTYQMWLSANAVAVIAVDRAPLRRTAEFELITNSRPPYLHLVWSTKDWTVYQVAAATPIVPRPAELVSATQADLTLLVSRPMTVTLRLRWSKLLTADGPPGATAADIDATTEGWTRFTALAAGTYVLRGRSL
jgi:hypothetical protein